MTDKTKLFVVLWLVGMIGVLSMLFIDFNAIIALVPAQAGREVPEITPALKLLSLVQPAVLLAVAVLVGTSLAEKVGLHAPAIEAAVSGGGSHVFLFWQLPWAVLGGIAGGISILATSWLALPYMPAGAPQTISKFMAAMPLVTRLGYGGITEEILLRWGFMTLVVWAIWKLFQKGSARPSAAAFLSAIVISSLLFGVGHLPVAYLLFGQPTMALIFFVVVANSAFGVFAGLLFWRRGLESAMIAHATTHLVLYSASKFGTYF